MKAMIMAGGEGTRLRPLTCALPKPMVPVLGRPVMEYTVDLLKKHGFDDITATLMYRPEEIQGHFGDSLSYFVETEPLGTAGGVKRACAQAGVRSTVLIMSGDSLTDIDLSAALGFHRERGAVATMLLVREENPTEYGVVVTGRDGRVMRFLEKPSPGEVLSDTINAGIYLLEPEALEAIPEGKYDFGQNLFPALVEAGKAVYGYVAQGYWCDIGDIATYMRAHRDALDGKIRGIRPGAGGLTIHHDARVEQGAAVVAPCWIEEGAVVREGARVGPYTVVGKNASIGAGASAVRSVLWEGAYLAVGAEARGALLMQGAGLLRGAQAYEGSVAGERTVVGERAILSPGALVWPHKQIEGGMRVHGSVVWGGAAPETLRGRGARGSISVLTPENCAALGAAFARAVGGTCAIGEGAQGAARMAADAFAGGYVGAGGRAYRLGACAPQSVRYAVRALELSGGCAARVEGGDLVLDFFSAQGGELASGTMRSLKQNFFRRDTAPAAIENIPAAVEVRGVRKQRINEFRTAVHIEGELDVHLHIDCADSAVLREAREMLEPCVMLADRAEGVPSALIQPDGEGFSLFDETGAEIAPHRFAQLFAPILYDIEPGAPMYFPMDATSEIDAVAASLGVEARRAHASRHAMLDMLSEDDDEGRYLWRALHFDAAAALLMLCAYLSRLRISLKELASSAVEPKIRSVTYPVREGGKAAAMRTLIDSTRGMDVTLDRGMRLSSAGGWALVFPSDDAPEFRVIAEGYSMEAADELAGFCIDLLRKTPKEP